MKDIKLMLFTDWHLMRWLRLALAVFISIQAIQLHDMLAGVIGIFLFYQVVANTGCCGSQGCSAQTLTDTKKWVMKLNLKK